MKLLRYGAPGHEKPGIIDAASRIRSLEGVVDDIAGDTLSPHSLDKLAALNLDSLPLVDAGTRIGPCVAGVGKFIAIGLNYSEHAAETARKFPTSQ